jgi:hypothetical protein
MRIAGCAEPIVGASGDAVSFIAYYAGRVAVPGRDRANDSAGAISDEFLFQHVVSSHVKYTEGNRKLATRKSLLLKGLQVAILCFSSVYFSWVTR